MNTIMIVACVLCTFAPAVPCNYITSSYELVRMSAAIEQNNSVIVAIVPKPIFTQSERQQLLVSIAESLAREFGYSNVTVTLDSDIYSAIELGTSDYDSINSKISLRGNAATARG